MNKDYLLSVIIPAFNAEKYIIHTITSIFKLGVSIEVIVVNDGSTDNTLALCYSMLKEYPNLKVLTQSNKGSVTSGKLAFSAGGTMCKVSVNTSPGR